MKSKKDEISCYLVNNCIKFELSLFIGTVVRTKYAYFDTSCYYLSTIEMTGQ